MMSEISGLAGDDLFVKDKNGKYWSVEVKHTKKYDDNYLAQAKRQAQERFDAIQVELKGEHKEVYEVLKLGTFTKNDYLLMWHPRGGNVAQNEWFVFYHKKGTVHLAMLSDRTEWLIS